MHNLRNDSKWALVLVCLVLVLGVTLPGGASYDADADASDDTRHEWVFVDTTVAGYQDLVDDVLAGGDDGRHIELVLLDGRRDGLEQIAEALAGRSGTDAIHLITHGSQAELQLGTARLTTDSMLGAYADALSEIGQALTDGGDILVYGCQFADGVHGRQAAHRLAELTGADVAASDDRTGARMLGGDWELEVHAGSVETSVAISTELQRSWNSVLQEPWWDTQWRKRTKITLDNSDQGENLVGFPVPVTLNTTNLPNLDLSATVGADVRFRDGVTGAEVKYEVEAWDDVADTATVWVKVPQIDGWSDTDYIWVYYDYNGAATYDQSAADEQAVWSANFAGAWHLEEPVTDDATGATHEDSTGTKNGTQNRNGAFPGKIATAQDFDGSSDYVSVGDHDAFSFGDGATDSPFSVSAWVWKDTANSHEIVNKTTAGASEWDFFIENNAHLRLLLTDGGNSMSRNTSAPAFPTGGWHHVVATYDGSGTNSGIKLYVDGIQPPTGQTFVGYGAMQNTATPVEIGAYDGGGNSYDMDGRIDEVRISSAERSADWIAASWRSQNGTFAFTNFDPEQDQGPWLSSARNQFFTVGAPSIPAASLAITDHLTTAEITSANDLRITIPAALNIIWDTSVTSFTAGGVAAGKVSTTLLAYEDGNRTAVIDVTSNFAAGERLTVDGLAFTSFTVASGPDNLELEVGNDSVVTATDDKTVEISNAVVLTTSGASTIGVGQPYTLNLSASAPVTSWTINWGDGTIDTYTGNPSSASHTYNQAGFTRNILASAVSGGTTYLQNELVVASGVTNSLMIYNNDGTFQQESDPAPGLSYPSDVTVGPNGILHVNGWSSDNGYRYDTAGTFIDEFFPDTGNPEGLSEANGLSFGPDGNLYIGSSGTGEIFRYNGTTGAFIDVFVASGTIAKPNGSTFGPDGHLYVVDYQNPGAVYKFDGTTGASLGVFVTAASTDLNIPTNLVFGPDGHLYVANDGAHKVNRYDGTTGAPMGDFVTAGSGGLDWTTGLEFGPDGHLYVGSWGNDKVLRFNGTTGAFIDEYVASGLGGLDQPENLTFLPEQRVLVLSTVVGPIISSSADKSFTVGAPATLAAPITITDDGTTPTITAANDLRIRIPAGFNMVWDTSVTAITPSGPDASKVSATLLAYEDAGRTAVIDVTTSFAVGDTFTLADLRFTSFTGTSGPDRLMLEVGNDDIASATDDKTVEIITDIVLTTTGAPTIGVGQLYTLNLSASLPVTSWTINWGDGNIDTNIPGTATSVSHPYAQAGFTHNILASAVSGGTTYFQNELLVGSGVTDSVLRYGTDGGFLQAFGTVDFPVDPRIGPDGNLYVSGLNSNNVTRYNATTGAFIDEFVVAGSGGLSAPSSIRFGPDGNLYVGSSGTAEVLRYNGTTGASMGAFVTAGSGGLSAPSGITFGPDGNLYVGDFTASAVFKYDGNTGASLGTFVAGGSGGLDTPSELTFGPDGNLYVGSQASDEVLRYNGTTGAFIDDFVTVGLGGLLAPSGAAFGPDGNLFVGSRDSDEVLRYNGTTGAFIDDYVAAGSGGLDGTSRVNFIPEQQVLVTAVVVGPLLSSAANQSFNVGGPSTASALATITDDGTAATITAAKDLRLRIPAGFNMTWDTSVTAITPGGGASGNVSATLLAYEDSDRTAVIDVTTNFSPGDVLAVAGLKFANFSAVSAADYLTLEVFNDSLASATDDKTVTIITTPLTGVSNAPSPDTVSDTSTHTVSFTTADPLPSDGKIVVTFPPGFDLTAVGDVDISSATMDGSFTVSAAGQVLTITRSGGSAQPAAAEDIVIANITNTSTAGTGYTVTVATQDSGSTPINGPTASSAFTIQGKLALANPDIQVTDQFADTSGTQPTDVALVGFKLTPTGESTSWSDLVVPLTYGGGMADADITSARIYVDLGTVGTYDSGVDTQVGAQSVSAAAGTLTWNAVGGTVAAATNYLIVFDTGAVLSNGETVQASVTAGNVTSTGATTSASITASGDVANEPLHTVTDATPPTITARTTRDNDGNGNIDRIELTFDESVDDSTANPTHFTVKGYTVTGVVTGGGVDDNQLFLTLTERPSPDTGAKPDVRYTQGTLTDLSTNLLASDGGVTATDGAAPVLLSATSSVASTTLTVTFSEAVDTSNAGAGDLVIADFSYIDVSVSGAASVSSMGADADGTDNVVRITVNTAFTAGDNATDTVAAAAAQIYDLADIAAGPTAVALTIAPDTTPPTITARTTRDNDGNGKIDRIELSFDENVDDSTANPTDFTVAGYTVTGVVTGGGVDDNQLFLTLTELASPDTGATPDVTYTQGTLADLSANLLASSWWDVLWLNRTKITFDNTASTEDLIDFPVLVSLTATEVNFADIEPLGADIRFVDHDGTPLDYEIEAWNDGAETATIWVRVQQIDRTSSTDFIWLYYNNPGEVDGQNAAGVWDANYGGVWHLEETVADELIGGNHDDSAGANNGTQNNNEGVPGKIAGAQDFDGTGDYIDLGNSATLMPSSVTTCAWAKREGPGDGNNFQDIVGRTEWDVGGYLLFLSDEATDVEWRVTDVLFIRAIKSSVITTSVWHFYCGTFSGSTSRLYVDGVLTNSNSTASLGTTTRSAAIGDGWAVDGNAQFDGLIDEVRISNAARSAEWIEASYLSQNGTFNTFSGAQVATIDGAAPVLLSAASSVGSTTLTVTFSEPVDTSNAGAGDLVVGDFTYNDVSGGDAGAISAMGADADGTDSVVTLTVDVPFGAGDNATDTIAAAASQIYDLVNLPMGTSPVALVIVAPTTLSSISNQSFTASDPTTAAALLTITEATSVTITAANDLRLRIPAGFNMTWDTGVTAVTIGGGAAAKVSGTLLPYEDGNRTAVLDVTSDFAPGEQITVSGLAFTSFTAPSAADNLELEVLNDNSVSATDDKTIEILAATATIVSAADQSFGVNNLATAIQTITVTDSGTPVITAANDIRIRIPATFNMTWDAADTTAVIGGTASGKVSTTVSYEDGSQTLVLDVTSDFASGEDITISGLSFDNFGNPESPDNLELEVDNAGGTEATDTRFIHISSAVLSSAANQSFQTGDAATASPVITITEDQDITTMRKRQDLRIRIPSTFPMKWDESVTSVTLGGAASAKVSATLKRYEDTGKTAVIDITTSFAALDQVTITGLQFEDFANPAAADNLELQVFRNGYVADEDDKTKAITVGASPTILSDVDQAFAAGDPSTLAATITITDTAAPNITKKNRIWITIPNSLNMVWDSSITVLTVGGTGAPLIKNPAVRGYLDNDKTVEIDVGNDFTGGEYITLGGLRFTNFTSVSSAASLTMSLDKGGTVADTDDNTKAIGGVILSSASNQTFNVGAAPTAAAVITITDEVGNSAINATDDLRITMPSTLPMKWDTTITSVVLGGNAAAKVSTALLRYEDNGRTMVLDVNDDFDGGDTLTVTGGSFTEFIAAAVSNLALEVGNDDQISALDDKTVTINGVGATTINSDIDQYFNPGDPPTTAAIITISNNNAVKEIKKKTDLRVHIPAAFGMEWDTSITTITVGGTGAAVVDTTVTYEGTKGVVIDVTKDFDLGAFVTISGLQFQNFAGPELPDNLELEVFDDNVVTDEDTQIIAILDLLISSAANQSFTIANPPAAASLITITEDAAQASITDANNIRIRIPASANLTWDTNDTTVTLGGTASGKVSGTVLGYEDAGKTVVLDVTADFAAGNVLTIDGLTFTNFTAASSGDKLGLDIYNSGSNRAVDDKTLAVTGGGNSMLLSAANQTFYVGHPATVAASFDVVDAATPEITDANNLRVRIPAGFNMTWDTTATTAIISGNASGKVSTTLQPFEDAGRTLVLDVTSNFAGGESITVSGLSFTSFTAASAVDNLELVVTGPAGATEDEDARTIAIGDVLISSAAEQLFTISSPATPALTITITESATSPAINAVDEIRIRIPAGFNMTWDNTVVNVTLGGTASGKVAVGVTYEDSDQTVVLDVTSDFAAGQTLTVDDLTFTNFTDYSPTDNLELEVANDGQVSGLDDKLISILEFAFRSIGINSGILHDSGLATVNQGTRALSLSVALPAGVGIGDRIVLDPGGAKEEVHYILSVDSPTTVTLQGSAFYDHSGSSNFEIRRAYNTLPSWESDREGDLVRDARVEYGVAYNDGEFILPVTIDGSTTDSVRKMNLIVADGQRHNGTDGTGVLFDGRDAGVSAITIRDDYTRVDGFEITGVRGASGIAAVEVDNASGVLLSRLLVYDFADGAFDVSGIEAGAASELTLRNSFIFLGDTAVRGTAADATATIENITVYNMTAGGVDEDLGTFNVTNAIAMNAVTDFSVTNGSQTTNLSADGTGTSTGTAANQFVSIGTDTEDLHLKAAAAQSIDQGTNLWAQFKNDIDGNVRTGLWDVGGHGFAAATEVTLVSFTADALNAAALLRWQTSSELTNLGFNLYRATAEDGTYDLITPKLVPGLGSSLVGASYSYTDQGLTNDTTYFYKLEDVETTGVATLHGPVSAMPHAGATAPPPEETPGGSTSGTSRITYGDPTNVSFRELERTDRYVLLELITGGFYAEPRDDGSVELFVPTFYGETQPGEPQVPLKQAWVEAIAGKKAKLGRVSLEEVVHFESLRPTAVSENGVVAERDGSVKAVKKRARRGKRFKQPGLFPERAAQLLGTGFIGSSKRAHVELAPLRWDRSYGQLVLVKRMTVKVLFKGRDTEDQERENRAATEPLVRLHVRDKGLYAVAFEELFTNEQELDTSSLALTRLGQPVAFHVESDPTGSVLYFLSDGAELNPYGPEAVYELGINNDASRPMHLVSAAPSGMPVDFYWERLEQEEDYYYQSSLVDAHDPWLWKFLFAPDTRFFDLPVDALAPSAEPAKLELWLQGGSDLPGNPDHHVRAVVNGTFLGEVYWSGTKPQKLDLELWPGVLVDGNNVLELENVGDTFAANSMVFVDRLALTYPRLAQARGGMLAGTVPYAGTLDVSGVGDAFFFDTTTGVPALLSDVENATFRVEAGRRYEVIDRAAVLQPLVTTASPYVLKRETNQADYILLGPQELLDVAQPLLDQRTAQGLLTWAVSIDTVFEEFGFGEPRPEAIKDFLSYAYHHWNAPAPRYVVLLGDGTWDFHDVLGTGVGNQVPPLMLKTRYIWASSDSAYAAVNGSDILPDLAIGRLPASSVEEAHIMVQKILDYENGDANFFRDVVLVADNADVAGDFEADADGLAATTLAGRNVDKLYLSQLGAAATRDAVLQSFDDGASIVSYLGHGSINLWADEKIFHNKDIPLLASQSQQPFVLTMNCLNGFFTLPYFDALAEKLVLAEDRGAIATFSPSGLSLNEPAKLFHKAMLEALTSGEHLRLGDAVLAAQEDYAETGAFPELLAIYHLFGDPALLMR